MTRFVDSLCPLSAPLAVLALLALSGSAAAVPLKNAPVDLVQPWGERLQALATGDEYRRRLHDASNHTLILDPTTGAWVYAQLDEGRLVPTAFVPGQIDPDVVGLPGGLDLSPELARAARVPLPRPLALAPSNAPRTGTLNNLVVLVRFADEAELGEPASTYEALFNSGSPSLRSYYAEVSYGELTVTTRFLPAPSNGWVVSYQDPHARSYYRPFSLFSNLDGYVSDNDRYDREQTLIYNATLAVQGAVPAGVDLDGDDDGVVDNVCYVVSGAADGWSDLLWSHMWELYQYNVTLGGAAVVTFDLVMRSQLDLFTLSHEMFHSLGAPDLYHYSQDGRTTVGDWDLMESGRGHMSAWMKHRYGGWLALPILGPGTHTLQPLAAGAGSAGILDLPGSPTQQLVVEYRRKAGTFESAIPGSGLVIYRVDTALNGNSGGPPDEVYAFRVGGTATSEGMYWESYFTSDVLRPAFGPGTDPAPFLADGTPVPLRVDDIGPAGTSITFTIKDCAAPCVGRACGDDGCGGSCGTCGGGQRCEDGACGVCLDTPSPTCTHTFTAPGSSVQPDHVWLTGNWLGWPSTPAAGAIPLTLGADGRWSADVPLPTGTAVQYKYLVKWFDVFEQWCVVAGGAWSCNNDPNMTATCTPPCVDFCVPTGETCNHADDDCDGLTDEGLSGCCVPACAGRECGDDGCGGSCGSCDDDDLCTVDACSAPAGQCTHETLACDDGEPCTADSCMPATGLCRFQALPTGIPCDDGDGCTLVDACDGGVCVGGTPVTCPAPAACHLPGQCNPLTGACDDPAKPDGLPCNDDDACTRVDACVSGECVGSSPIACREPGPCELSVTCNPDTGACDATVTPFGVACDDGNACTGVSFCSEGACVGAQPVVCPAPAACHVDGTCDPATGTCSTPVAPDDTPCDDGSACTRVDRCQAGACQGADPVGCPPADACHLAGSCDPATGACSSPLAPDGTACPADALACTADSCQGGACLHPVVDGCLIGQVCVAADDDHPLNPCEACLPEASRVAFSPRADGTACTDQHFCTDGDACHAGACQPGPARTCPAPADACHRAACDEAADACTLPARDDGTACDDGDLCTARDECAAGACAGRDPVVCPAPTACHVAGVCAPSTGLCAYASEPDGTPCDDGAFCTIDDACEDGACTRISPRDCSAVGGPCRAAGCDEATDACTALPLPAGTPCGDPRRCDGGLLDAADACDAAGTCVDGGVTSCAPYATCATAGECAASCTVSAACVAGFDCVGGACVVNQAPSAVAGAAQAVGEAVLVTLAADGSSDPEGQPLAYAWSQVAGPAVQLDDATALRAHFTAPTVLAPALLSFRLVVSDGLLPSEPAVTMVSVANTINEAPVASAFAETPEVDEGAELTLDGSDSVDPNGDPLSYLWTQQDGPAAELDDPAVAILLGVAPQVDADTWLTFALVVDDGADEGAPAIVQVWVRDRTEPEPAPEEPVTPDAVEEAVPDTTDAEAAPEAVAETMADAAGEHDAPDPSDTPAPDVADADHAEASPDIRDVAPDEADLARHDATPDPQGPDSVTPDATPPDQPALDQEGDDGADTTPGSGKGSGCAVTGLDGGHARAGALALAVLALGTLLLGRRSSRRAASALLLLVLLAGCLSATRQRPDRDTTGGETAADLPADLAADTPADAAPDPGPEATPDAVVDTPPGPNDAEGTDVPADTPADLGPDTCLERPCSPGDHPELHPGPCEQVAWSPTACACVVVPLVAPTPCDDGNPCTIADGCKAGACDPGYPDPACTCNPASDTCEAEHSDHDACNGTLRCVEGACAVDPDTVPEPCLLTGLAPCHVSACVPATGVCAESVADDGEPCSDGNPCTLVDTCTGGQCNPGLPRDCNDFDPCTADACVAGTGLCKHTLTPSGNGEICNGTDDDCDGQTDEEPGAGEGALCSPVFACVGGSCLFSCSTDADCEPDHVCVTGASGLGQCASACVASCPNGYGYLLFDGCHCRVPPTGADKCLIPAGWALCESLTPSDQGYGQDATFDGQALAYNDLGDGTVVDLQTLVVWSHALLPAGVSVADAKDACQANAAGLPGTDWALPGLHALFGTVDFGVSEAPFWSQAVFGDFGGWVTWSSTPAAAGGGNPYMFVDFSKAEVVLSDSANKLDARCARLPAPTPVPERYRVTRQGHVLDRLTGLVWRVQNACAQCTWFAALAACVDLGPGWRLPTAKEALSLVDYAADACSLLPSQFGADCPMYSDYWTSTPYPDARAAALDIGIGYLQPKPTSDKKAVRCVRAAP